MKHYNHKLLLLIPVIALAIASCKRTYEAEPLEKLSGDYVWDTQDSLGTNAGKFLVNIYSYLPNGFNRVGGEMLDAATDDAVSSSLSTNNPVNNIARGGGYDLFGNEEFSGWGTYYAGIRQANIFLNNINVVPLRTKLPNGRPVKEAWRAEARFLRAFFYFEMLKRFGGVPLVGDTVKEITDNALIPRNTFSQCVDYIVSECDAIKDSLRTDPMASNSVDYGRVTKGAALALKARVLLYAASPLFNHQGSAGLPGGRASTEGIAWYPDYSQERWRRAAAAAEDIIRYGKFELSDSTLFISRNNEIIFARNSSPNTDIEKNNGPVGFASPNDGSGRNSPTLELVNAFLTHNGKSITDDPEYDPEHPELNREDRFYSTILFNGALWLNTTLQTYDGGFHKPASNIQKTVTSFYLRKFMGMFGASSGYASTLHNFPYFRYGEVLLNYAEAENEVNGPTDNVVKSIIALRARAGIDIGANKRYGIKEGISKPEMRELIHNERRIELAFEEHRYWDTRRWLIAQKVLTGDQHGLKLLRSNANEVSGQVVVVRTANFGDAKRYLYPIPYSELTRNDKLVQNPGW